MPRRRGHAWPTDTIGQRWACIAAVAAVLYAPPALIALVAEHLTAFAR